MSVHISSINHTSTLNVWLYHQAEVVANTVEGRLWALNISNDATYIKQLTDCPLPCSSLNSAWLSLSLHKRHLMFFTTKRCVYFSVGIGYFVGLVSKQVSNLIYTRIIKVLKLYGATLVVIQSNLKLLMVFSWISFHHDIQVSEQLGTSFVQILFCLFCHFLPNKPKNLSKFCFELFKTCKKRQKCYLGYFILQ